MSNPEQVAFENLQRLAAMFRGIIEIAPELQKISSLKGAQDEALARLDQIKADTDKAQEDGNRRIKDAQDAAEKIKAEAGAVLAKAHDDASKVIEAAKRGAVMHTEQAIKAADQARRDVARDVADNQQKLEALKAEYDEWRQRVQETEKDHVALVSAVSEKQSEHERIQAAIAEAKAKFG